MADKGTIIIGLGNPILSDDSVGVKAARILRERLRDRNDLEVIELYAGGLRLMDALIGHGRAIIIDSMRTGAAVGTIRKFALSDLPKTLNLTSSHDVDLPTALELAKAAAQKQHFDLPVVVNPEVTSLIGFYTGRYRERFIVALD